jgi:hypothetical protein
MAGNGSFKTLFPILPVIGGRATIMTVKRLYLNPLCIEGI